jgi:hypothetical protein
MGLIRECYIEVGDDGLEEELGLFLEEDEVCDSEFLEGVEVIDDIGFEDEPGFVFVLFCGEEGREVVLVPGEGLEVVDGVGSVVEERE